MGDKTSEMTKVGQEDKSCVQNEKEYLLYMNIGKGIFVMYEYWISNNQ